MKPLILFGAAFLTGAVLALAVRSALHQPYGSRSTTAESPAYAPLVNNRPPPEIRPPAPDTPSEVSREETPGDPHAEHAHADPTNADPAQGDPAHPASPTTPAPASLQPSAGTTVNTRCPICGMPVDPSLPPAEYQGQLVGFGCRACPPKFARDPDRYGPAALRNEVVRP